MSLTMFGVSIVPVMNKISFGHMAAPRVDVGLAVDYSVFKKDPLERGKIWKAKRDHKKAMRKAFPGGTKQFNTTAPFYSRSTF